MSCLDISIRKFANTPKYKFRDKWTLKKTKISKNNTSKLSVMGKQTLRNNILKLLYRQAHEIITEKIENRKN